MQFIACTLIGLENIAISEIKEILNIESKTLTLSRVEFEEELNNIPKLIYNIRSASKIYQKIAHFKFKNKNEILNQMIPKLKPPFVVRCQRKGTHDFSSLDIEKELGEKIFESQKAKVDLKNPKTTIIVDILNDECIIGIDLTGISLTKRDYRLRVHSQAVNPLIAFAMAKISDPKGVILDPFCLSGEIAIETSLYLRNISPNKHNKNNFLINKLIKASYKDDENKTIPKIYASDPIEPNTRATELNARIVSQKLILSRVSIEDLDLKYKNIDTIITYVPKPTEQIFSQFHKITSPNAIVTILSLEPRQNAKGFKLKEELKIQAQNKTYCMQKWTKEKNETRRNNASRKD